MKPLKIVAVVIAIIVALWVQRSYEPGTPSAPVQSRTAADQGPVPQSPADELVVRDVTVRDIDGRVAWRGDVDLAPEVARATSGERDGHRNDGGVFANREGLLPVQRGGYYHEYVIRTEGVDHAGPQRLVLGGGGEVFYTSDHYASFRRIR